MLKTILDPLRWKADDGETLDSFIFNCGKLCRDAGRTEGDIAFQRRFTIDPTQEERDRIEWDTGCRLAYTHMCQDLFKKYYPDGIKISFEKHTRVTTSKGAAIDFIRTLWSYNVFMMVDKHNEKKRGDPFHINVVGYMNLLRDECL